MKDWKHLTFEQRKVISNGISHNYKLKEIAETLGFDPTSISKEVKRNRKSITIGLNVTNCKKKVTRWPYVCTGCNKRYNNQYYFTKYKYDAKNYQNLLEQDFYTNIPSQKWVGDITYIYTKETGWTYLAIVMDLFDLKVVGWSYELNMTENLVIEAFTKALINRGLNKDGIFHSDRGSQYTSNNFEQLLTGLNLKHSYSKKGYPYDNASMESFNTILKKEEVNVKL